MPELRTCGELADWLAAQPRDRMVVLQKDPEGNGYSPLAEASEALYEAETPWAGESYPTPEDKAAFVACGMWAPADASEVHEPGERVIVLAPKG